MKTALHLLASSLLLAMCQVHAANPPAPTRWVKADDVRVRTGPSPEHRISGTLPRGAELRLRAPEANGFCEVEGDNQYGYVACQFLSPTKVARPQAGIDGIPANQRWVTGNSVTLRDAPNTDAAIVQRLTLNSIVTLAKEQSGSGYCDVQAAGVTGFTACRYLSPQPLDLARLFGEVPGTSSSPDYAPDRVFWIQPSWSAMLNYAEYLQKRLPAAAKNGPWPRDEVLEKMKAHLALGIKGSKPPAYADWADLKRKAARDLDLSGAMPRLQAQGKPGTPEQQARAVTLHETASALQTALSLWGHMSVPDGADLSNEGVVNLVRALDLPVVAPSLFRSEAELAPPGASAEEASGRFGIVFRQLTSARPAAKTIPDQENSHGVYDILTRTQALVRPVQRVQLFRDGKLRAEPSMLSSRLTMWGELDEPMCHDWTPGFAYGHADTSIWNYFGHETDKSGQETAKTNRNAPGSLFAFYTASKLPDGPALRVETSVKLNRATTGFTGGTHMHFDLDGDGIHDVSIWEGMGRAQGHLDGPTKQDDRWYRLALVNINGAWKVLGADSFGYGCGC